MFVRLVTCKFLPERIVEARKVFMNEIIPTLQKQNGLIDVRFLEPTEKKGNFISITEWKTKENIEAYEKAGLYQKLVKKLEPFFMGQPELTTYTTEEVFEHV